MKTVPKILVILLLFLTGKEAFAQKKSENNTLLYKVEKKGNTPFYLFGTMHLICADQFRISESLENVIDKAETLYLELDMNDINPLAVFSKAVSPNALDKFLEPATVDSLKQFISKESGVNIPWMMVNKLQPIFIQQLFMQGMLDCKTESIDLYLNKRFGEMKKTVKGLETFDFQLEMMTSIAYKDQVESLLQFMRQPVEAKEQFRQMVAAYLKGDAEELFQFINEDKSFADLQDGFLFERNANWVKMMKANNDGLTYLYAFGAGHLGGKKGVLELLKREGYKITPLK